MLGRAQVTKRRVTISLNPAMDESAGGFRVRDTYNRTWHLIENRLLISAVAALKGNGNGLRIDVSSVVGTEVSIIFADMSIDRTISRSVRYLTQWCINMLRYTSRISECYPRLFAKVPISVTANSS